MWRSNSPVFMSGCLHPGISALNFEHVFLSYFDVGHSSTLPELSFSRRCVLRLQPPAL